MCPSPPTKDWVDVLTALLTPVIAVAAVLIGILQERTNRARLRHELFDRRYAQFAVVRDFLGSIVTSGKVSEEKWRDFLVGTKGAAFLFDESITAYLEAINERAVDSMTLDTELEGLPVGEERSNKVTKNGELRKWLRQELRGIESKFAPFLKLA